MARVDEPYLIVKEPKKAAKGSDKASEITPTPHRHSAGFEVSSPIRSYISAR